MPPEKPGTTRRTVIKGLAFGAAACAVGPTAAGAEPAPTRRLRRVGAEAAGIEPTAVLAFIEAVERSVGGLHGFMLLRHGQVAAEGWWDPYAPAYPHMLFSLSKSFTSTAVGLAVAEGRLTVDDPVLAFFPAEAPAERSEHLRAMRVRHLLSMSTGHEKDATGSTVSAPDGDWARSFLALPVEREPGSLFVYNSAATYMLSAIVQRVTGQSVLAYLTPRLFAPLGVAGATWESCPRGVNTGGWGLSITTEAIARFGQLYLQRGRWEGKQLVPESWIEEATAKHIANGTGDASDWTQGYGYQFWRCRHGGYRGDGAFGQYCVVMPAQDAVLAITSGVADMQAVLNATWDHLLPAMRPGRVSDPRGASALKARLASLSVAAPDGARTSATAADVSGATYRFDANEEKIEGVTLTFEDGRSRVTLRDARGDHAVEAPHGSWAKATATDAPGEPPTRVAARGAWSGGDTYTLTVCFLETPFVETTRFAFAGDRLTMTRRTNVGFGPTERPTLVGYRA
ncbi:MAG: serine hydrolase [Chthonomonadales bacterium]|nr:serine hydrolase [Chthonomonadales bacterium]